MDSPPTGGSVIASKYYEGLTLRDYFATAVLQGWMANSNVVLSVTPDLFDSAYSAADEMLKARNKK